MEIDIDIYFWMVDRGLFDDDQRNKVELEVNKVRLHREHSQRFENGYYIGQVLTLFKKSIMKLTKKPFTLDPAVANMKDNITSTVKQMNWNVLSKELKKFGIRVDSEKKSKIIEGRTQLINEILAKLFEFDNNGGIQGRYQDGGSLSEINMANLNNNNNNEERAANDSNNVSIIDGTSPILKGNPKRTGLAPLGTQKRSIAEYSQISNSISKSSSKVNLGPRDIKNSVNQSLASLNDLQETKDLADSETTFEFILLSLARNLNIKPKQAAGLLSNNHKYLVHIAVKGMKGQDYSKIQQWYQDIYQYTKTIVQLIDAEKEQSSMKLTMSILKVGLYSQNVDLVINCSRLLSKIGQDINTAGGELCGLAWDWLVTKDTSQQQQSLQPGQTLKDVQVPDLVNDLNMTVSKPNLDQTSEPPLSESGLQSCFYSLKRHSNDVVESIAPVLIHFGKNNPMELFNYHLRSCFETEPTITTPSAQFLSLIHEIMNATSATSLFKDNIVNTGVLDEWINYALRLGDFDANQANTPVERSSALAFLADCFEFKCERLDEDSTAADTAQAILSVLKRGCRDRSKVLRIVSFELTFKLLHDFASGRNQFAPILYKTLTFLLIEFHQDGDLREQLMKHFITLFQQIQTIPVAILCDPLIKQIELSQSQIALPAEVLQSQQAGSQPQTYVFNIYDFEFFSVLAHHKRITIQTALSILDLMSTIATQNIFFANTSIAIMLEIITKFNRDPQLHASFNAISRAQLLTLEDIERQKLKNNAERQKAKDLRSKKVNEQLSKNKTLSNQNKYHLKKQASEQQAVNAQQDSQLEATAISLKTKERMLVNLFKQVIMFANDLIKQNLRHLLLWLYTKLDKEIKVQSKALQYLLGLYGEDLPQMLQYFLDNEKGEQDEGSNKGSIDTEQIAQQIERVSQSLFKPKLDRALVPVTNDQTMSLPTQESPSMTKKQKHLEKVLKEIEKVKNQADEHKEKKIQAEEQKKAKQDRANAAAKKLVDQRNKYEYGVFGSKGKSVDATASKKGLVDESGQQLQIKIIKPKDDISEINLEDEQRLMIPEPLITNTKQAQNAMLKQLKQFQLYDIRLEEQKDQDAVRFFVKKNLRIFRNLFNKYANTLGPATQVRETFDALSQKNTLITVAELLKMLKEFGVSSVQASKDDVMQMVRLINMDILKKKGTRESNSLSVLEFEGFVEFMLQLAVHLYSFDADMSPQAYFQKLFDSLKKVASDKKLPVLKLFEDPTQTSVGDQQLLSELTRRLQQDPNFHLPDGFFKQVDKDVVLNYQIPEYFPIPRSQKIAIEVLDGFFNDVFGFHILEPISEVKEVVRARANLKAQAKDKTMHEINQSSNLKMQTIPLRGRSRQPQLKNQKGMSNSIDDNPIKSVGQIPTANKDASLIISSKNQSLFKSPRPSVQAGVKPPLGIYLKLEVTKAPAPQRPQTLETAYVLEEILLAVEQGHEGNLPDPQSYLAALQKPKITNRITEDRARKEEEQTQQKAQDKARLEMRKKLLRDQLEKMKGQKDVKLKEDAVKQTEDKKKEEEMKKRRDDKKRADIQKMMAEIQQTKEAKKKEEEEKKKTEDEKKGQLTERTKKDIQGKLKEKTAKIQEEFKKKAEDRKASLQREEEEAKKKQQSLKAKQDVAKKINAENVNKAKEAKEKAKQEFQQYTENPEVVQAISAFDRSIQSMFEQYCKLDSIEPGLLSYNSYVKMGQKAQITPQLLSSQDYLYIYKTILRQKVSSIADSVQDIQGSKLNIQDFKETLVKIACLAKIKLGGLSGSESEIKAMEDQQKLKQKLTMSSIELQKQITQKQPRDKSVNQSINSSIVIGLDQDQPSEQNPALGNQKSISKQPLLGALEKEFDVAGMTAQTLINLFKQVGLRPERGLGGQLDQTLGNGQGANQDYGDENAGNDRSLDVSQLNQSEIQQ